MFPGEMEATAYTGVPKKASIRMVGFLFMRKAEKSHILLLSANWMPKKLMAVLWGASTDK